ncbi:MAG TPA: hypothetical protein DEA96_07650, partial [Leptospiraceae bacterium]|nr:hypothetical protein [Leptospiraceae bacterium]
MYSFQEHYKQTLAPYYTRVYGGTEKNYALARSIFEGFGITAAETGGARSAADLGSGSGFFSLPLAHLGYQVLALDLDPYLCEEHRKLCKDSNVQVICDDLLNLPGYSSEKMDIILCMTDTLAHLESEEQILALLRMVADSLKSDGSFLISFRDQSNSLEDDHRFIPFYSDSEL